MVVGPLWRGPGNIHSFILDGIPKQSHFSCQISLGHHPLRARRVAWIKTEREGVKSGRYGALKSGKLDLNCNLVCYQPMAYYHNFRIIFQLSLIV